MGLFKKKNKDPRCYCCGAPTIYYICNECRWAIFWARRKMQEEETYRRNAAYVNAIHRT